MSRYIDEDHLRKWILSWWERTEPTSEYLKGRDILNQIDREPSIDIVFCKECRHKQQCRKAVEHITHDLTSVTIGYKSVEWCSYGEREGE